jgi:hypothetical protein
MKMLTPLFSLPYFLRGKKNINSNLFTKKTMACKTSKTTNTKELKRLENKKNGHHAFLSALFY